MSGVLQGTINLSPVRTAILLVQTIDLQDKLEGGVGVGNITSAVYRVLKVIEPRTASEPSLAESVRVAIYRFEQFISESPEFRSNQFQLKFDLKTNRLKFTPDDSLIAVEITCGDQALSELADELFSTSPLERLRRLKSLYVPPGPTGIDRLLLEFYQQPNPLVVHSLFFRSAILNCPQEVLEALGASTDLLERHRLALEGLKSGKVIVNEIIHEDNLWDLIRLNTGGNYSYYPSSIMKEQVLAHLDHLAWRVTNLTGFNLSTTRAQPPMHVVTYEIQHPNSNESGSKSSEYFTACFRQVKDNSTATGDVSTYMVNDPVVAEVLSENIIDWVKGHPSTTGQRAEVVEKIRSVRDYLHRRGPLKIGEQPLAADIPTKIDTLNPQRRKKILRDEIEINQVLNLAGNKPVMTKNDREETLP